MVIAGCPCHILRNAAEEVSEAFAVVLKFGLENHCVDVFHWFEKSTKGKSILKEYYDFYDVDY